MIELFVEKYSVDVDKSFSVMLTMAIDDIKDFSAKNTTFSKTIILPGTNRNNVLFGNLFDINAGNNYTTSSPNTGVNFNASVSASAIMFADNIQIFKGTFRILEVVIDNGNVEYEAVVFGELGGFVSKMGAAKLEELDFSAYNHTYSIANIIGSQSNVGSGSGYIYPNNIDYGNYSTNKKDWKIGSMRPALFVKEYIDKIFTESGYTYNCDLFTGSTTAALRFKKLVIPHNRKVLTASNTKLLDQSSTSNTIDLSTRSSIVNVDIIKNGSSIYSYSSTAVGTRTIIATSITLNTSNTIRVDINSGLYQIVFDAGTGSIGAFTTSDNITYTYAGTPTLTVTIKLVIYYGSIVSASPDPGFIVDYTANILVNSNTATPVPISLTDTVLLNDTIPQNILQKDFISSIVKLFNLYIFEDRENDKLLKIMPFVDFYADTTALDWSNKIDRSQPLRIKPMSELNARYYDFKFKEDADYYNDLYKKRYNESYGTYKYDSGFEFSKDSTTIELIFSGTPLIGYSGETKFYSTIFKRTGDVTGAAEENIDSNIRILQTKMITSGVASWSIKDATGTTTLGTYTSYLYAGHFDDPNAPANDIQFGVPKEIFFTLVTGALNVNQFNVYWSSYMAEITDKDSKLLTCKVKLSNKDIFNIDFKKLIWIDGSLFRLNKIIDFNASSEDTCTIELLKVINKIY